MNDTERLLGRLSEFKDQAMDRFDRLEDKQDKTDSKVDELQTFKWRIAGGAAVLSFLFTALAEFFHIYLKVGG